jgi:hypothetical protein
MILRVQGSDVCDYCSVRGVLVFFTGTESVFLVLVQGQQRSQAAFSAQQVASSRVLVSTFALILACALCPRSQPSLILVNYYVLTNPLEGHQRHPARQPIIPTIISCQSTIHHMRYFPSTNNQTVAPSHTCLHLTDSDRLAAMLTRQAHSLAHLATAQTLQRRRQSNVQQESHQSPSSSGVTAGITYSHTHVAWLAGGPAQPCPTREDSLINC